MHDDRRRWRSAGREQHRRPGDRVEAHDVLSDDVDPLARLEPVPPVEVVVRTVSEGRDVVRERVVPDVHHLRRIAGHRNAPAARPGDRARNAEIFEPAGDECPRLLMSRLGNHAERARVEQRREPVGVAGEPEEVVVFVDDLGSDVVLGASPVCELVGGDEALAPHAVEATVRTAVDVASRHACFPEAPGAIDVTRIRRRPDEIVVPDVERARERPEDSGVSIDERAHGNARALGGEHVRQAVLVGAGEQADVGAAQPVIARDRVRLHQLEREAEMRLRVDEGNRGRDVDRGHRASSRRPAAARWRKHDGHGEPGKPTRGRGANYLCAALRVGGSMSMAIANVRCMSAW